MARIGHWRHGELGVFLTDRERKMIDLVHGQAVCASFHFDVLQIQIHREDMGGPRAFYPLYDNGTGEDAGWLRNKWPGLDALPRWCIVDIEALHVTHSSGLRFDLPSWWDLPWPKYKGRDICRDATIDFLKKCVLTKEMKRPHPHVAPQAVNFARKGLAGEYLEKIDMFIPASADPATATGAQTHCRLNSSEA